MPIYHVEFNARFFFFFHLWKPFVSKNISLMFKTEFAPQNQFQSKLKYSNISCSFIIKNMASIHTHCAFFNVAYGAIFSYIFFSVLSYLVSAKIYNSWSKLISFSKSVLVKTDFLLKIGFIQDYTFKTLHAYLSCRLWLIV